MWSGDDFMSRSPMNVASGLVHIAAKSACVILVWMAAESDCAQRRAVPKSLTERFVTAVPIIFKIWELAIRPKRLQRYTIHPKEKNKNRRN